MIRVVNEADVRGSADEGVVVKRGVAGWDGETGSIDELGTDSNDGTTLVRVQLFDGRLPGGSPQQGVAEGHKIKCQVSGPLWAIPPAGQVVLVAFPDGHVDAPGSGVIVAWLGKSPSIQFKKGRAVIDLGSQDLVIRANSVTLSDQGSPACWLCVGPNPADPSQVGIVALTRSGAGLVSNGGDVSVFGTSGGDVKSILQLGASVASLTHQSNGGIEFASTVQLRCTGNFWAFYPQAWLGLSATSLSPSGSGPPGSLNMGKAMLAQAPSFSVGSPAASGNTFLAVM